MRQSPLALALLLSLSLAACGGDDEAAQPDAGGASPETVAEETAAAEPVDELPPLPSGDFRITSVTLGKAVDDEGQVREPLAVFAPTDKIYAAVVSVGSSDGLTLSAQWTTAEGTDVAKAGQSLNPESPTVTTFSIAQPEPWPVGAYQLVIAINGRAVETRSFEVQ
jgi:nucleoid-associated protein YgaU